VAKLKDKVAVIAGATLGMALATDGENSVNRSNQTNIFHIFMNLNMYAFIVAFCKKAALPGLSKISRILSSRGRSAPRRSGASIE
jgi:hypothetical protein